MRNAAVSLVNRRLKLYDIYHHHTTVAIASTILVSEALEFVAIIRKHYQRPY